MNKMHRHVAKYNRKAPTNHKQPYTVFNPHIGPAPLGSNTQIKSALDQSAEIPSQCEVESRGQPHVLATRRGNPSLREGPLESFIQIMSVDPGIRNCGLRIEQRRLLDNILVDVKTVVMVRINFNEEDHLECKNPETVVFDTSYYTRSTDILDKFLPYAIQCQYILIESQLPINYSMVRMSQHIITYLCLGVKNRGCRPLIIEIDPHLKSRLLHAPSKMKKPELKKWCRQKALDVLSARDDNVGHDAILKVGKGDDMGDTVCQCEAWWVILCGQLHAPPLPHFSELGVDSRSIRERIAVETPGPRVLTEVPLVPLKGPMSSRVNIQTGILTSSPCPTLSESRGAGAGPGSETPTEIVSTGKIRLRIGSMRISETNESQIQCRPSIKLPITKISVPEC
jgi:hypothetical protein